MNKKSLIVFSAILQLMTTPVLANDYGLAEEAADADAVEGAALTPKKVEPTVVKVDGEETEESEEEAEPAPQPAYFSLGAHYGTSALQDEGAGGFIGVDQGSANYVGRLTLGANAADKEKAPLLTGSFSVNNGRLWCQDMNEKFCLGPMLNMNGIYGGDGNVNGANSLTLNGLHRLNLGKDKKQKLELTYGLGIGDAYVSQGRKKEESDGRAHSQDHRDGEPTKFDTADFWGLALNVGAYGKFVNDKMTAGAEVTYFTRNGLFVDGVAESDKVKKGAYLSARLKYELTDSLAAKASLDIPWVKAKAIDDESKVDSFNAMQGYIGLEFTPAKRKPAKAKALEEDAEDAEDDFKDVNY